MLADEGMVMSTAAAVDVEKILANTDVEKLKKFSELKYLLGPLLCRNKEEQDKVYIIFDKLDAKAADEYKELIKNAGTTIPNERIPPKWWENITSKWMLQNIVTPAAIVLALVPLVWFFWDKIVPSKPGQPEISKINIVASSQQIVLKDTILFSAVIDSSLNKKNSNVDWKFADTVIRNSFAAARIFKDTSTVMVTAFLKDAKGTIIDSANYSARALCELPPSVTIDESDISVNQLKPANGNKKQFAPLFTNGVRGEQGYTYKWYINDSLHSTNKTFSYSKPYNIVKLVVGCRNIHCSTDSLVAQVESTPALNAGITGDNNLKIKSAYNWSNILKNLLLLLVVPGIISLLLFRIILSVKKYIPDTKGVTPGTEGPYTIKFNEQQHNINTDAGIRRLADILRKRQVSDIYKLNLRKTIRSTVAAGGIPKLEFSPLSKPVNFLVFIDKEKPDSFLVKLFEYLAEKLRKDEVNIVVYNYFKEPLFLTNEKLNQERIPLEKIASLYPDTTLFIFGEAQYFLYPVKGTVKDWVTRKLNSWPVKILITPFTNEDWDKKEKLLIESNFVVLPADLSSLPVIDKIISGQIDIPAQKKEHLQNSYRSRFLKFQDFDTLKNYLCDGPLLQWVCSLAIYPATDWDLTIAIGKAIEQKLPKNDGQADLVNYTNLLKIARISWMQDGIINESLRVKMLSYLDKDAEALARETLSTQLYLIEDAINDDSLVKARFNIHQKLNRFLLDSYHHNKIKKEDEAFIKRAFTLNRLDEGQDIYLDEGDNLMLPNPFKKGEEVGLNRYFKLKTMWQILHAAGYALVTLTALVVVSFILLKNNSLYFNWSTIKPVDQHYVLNVKGNDINRELTFDLYYEPTHKKWREQKLLLANTTDTFSYNGIAITDTSGYGLIEITTKNGQLITRDSFKLNSAVYNINIQEKQKTPLKIFYKDASAFAIANAIADNLPANFWVSMQQQVLPDTAKASVYYFSPGSRENGLFAASTVNALLNTNIQPGQVDSLNFAQAQASVIIYVNSPPVTCTPVSIAALPKSLVEIWHGGTSNRLLNINLAKRVMYYSVNDEITYGTYNIDEICLTKNSVYKIITKTQQGYKLFFIRNIKAQSFELSVCQNFVPTKAELENKDETYCDRFNVMIWYYLKDVNRIFLPVSGSSLVSSEKQKLDKKADSINNPAFETEYLESPPPDFINKLSNNSIAQIFANSNIKFSLQSAKEINGKANNPFQRGYFNIIITKKPVQPRCDIMFYSIEETSKLSSPLIVCKIDLSKAGLTSIPKELYEFKNMQQLNLGTTRISKSEIDQLQRALPKCVISYKPYTTPPPVNKKTLGFIFFDKKGIRSDSRIFMDSISKILRSYPAASIVINGEYFDNQSQKIMQDRMSQVMTYFSKQGVNEKGGQISQKFGQINNQQQQQQQNQIQSQSGTLIVVDGYNFPSDSYANPKTAN